MQGSCHIDAFLSFRSRQKRWMPSQIYARAAERAAIRPDLNFFERTLRDCARRYPGVPASMRWRFIASQVTDEITGLMYAFGAPAVAALMTIRVHGLVVRGERFEHAEDFARSVINELRSFENGRQV
jgi:hypothetical protein